MDFQQADVLAYTCPLARSEGHETPFHLGQFCTAAGCLEPPLGTELVHAVPSPEDAGVLVDDGRVAAHDGTAGEVVSAQRGAAFGDDALENQPDGRVEAEGLFDHGAEVGERARFAKRRERAELGRVELVEKAGETRRVREEEVEDGPECYGGRVGAGVDVAQGPA